MEQLRNSLEIALYCMARDEARAGYPCRSNDFFDRDKLIFEAGHQDGKKRPLCAEVSAAYLLPARSSRQERPAGSWPS
jgi:hypothetical protein